MNKLKISVVALLSITMLTACSITEKLGGALGGQEQETPPPTETTTAAPKFDTGDYRTTPNEPRGETDESLTRTIEMINLAEYIPLPYEIDPVVSEGIGSQPISGSGSMAITLTDAYVRILEENPLLYGYQNNAKSVTEKETDTGFSINHAVIRFEDPETAEKVAGAFHQEAITNGYRFSETDPPIPAPEIFIDGMPQTRVTSTTQEYNNSVAYTAVTPHAEYLIYTWASAPADQEQWNAEFIKKAYEKQIPLLEQFPSVKTAKGYGKTDEFPPFDPGKIMPYVVKPLEDEQAPFVGPFGPRGISGMFKAQETVHNSVIETGSIYNAVWGSIVFRADNDRGGQALLNTLVSRELELGRTEYDEPQGVPDTTCTTETTASGATYSCYVINGRYVAEMTIAADANTEDQEKKKKQLSQKVAAQYLIFQEADQEFKVE